MRKSIIPNLARSPYYILTPRYIRTSAGIRALHLLCHWLNRYGERAFVVLSYIDDSPAVSLDLQTPVLTQEIIDYHYEHGVRPIVVYPEVVAGNPLEAECVVRWVLNFPGLLGGDSVYAESEMLIGFSKVLAAAAGENVPILHIPVLNEDVFHPGEPRPRQGAAFYAMKYKDVHDGEVFGVPAGAIEITRDRPDSQTPEEIAEILRSVELIYVFENTAIATEAVLCGCPVVFMPNPWFDQPIALHELGSEGYAWGDDPAEVERARSTVVQGQANYRRTVDEFFAQLEQFISRSQSKAAEGPYTHKINPALSAITPTGQLADDMRFYPPAKSILTAREIASLIKLREDWRLSEWLRINKAVVSVWWRRRVRDPLRRARQALLGAPNGSLGAPKGVEDGWGRKATVSHIDAERLER